MVAGPGALIRYVPRGDEQDEPARLTGRPLAGKPKRDAERVLVPLAVGSRLKDSGEDEAYGAGVHHCYGPCMSQRVPFTGGEKESLHVSLDRHRDAVLWKLEGVDEEQAGRPMTHPGRVCWGW